MDYWEQRIVEVGADRAAWDDDHEDTWRHVAMIRSGDPNTSVEIGCGPGRLLEHTGAIGVDSSPTMVRTALERGLVAVLSNGRTLPFPDESVDLVYSMLTFQHLPEDNVSAYLCEAHRILKPGGWLRFQFVHQGDLGPHNYPIRVSRMSTLLHGAGFEHRRLRADSVEADWAWAETTR